MTISTAVQTENNRIEAHAGCRVEETTQVKGFSNPLCLPPLLQPAVFHWVLGKCRWAESKGAKGPSSLDPNNVGTIWNLKRKREIIGVLPSQLPFLANLLRSPRDTSGGTLKHARPCLRLSFKLERRRDITSRVFTARGSSRVVNNARC